MNRSMWVRLAVAAAVWLVLAACTNVTSPPPEEPAPDPEEAAAAAAVAEQAEGVLLTSLRALSMPAAAAQAEGIEALADFTVLVDPAAAPPSVEGCAPMLSEGADDDGDGYPAVRTTLRIDCSIDVPFVFQLMGSLVLADEDDMDPASGFESELDYRLTVTADGETLTAVGERDVRVSLMEDGSGYDLEYEGRDVLNAPYLEYEARLTYTGTLEGSFESGTLAIGDGSVVLTLTPVDCTALGDAEREACEEQVQENPGSAGTLPVQTTRLAYDTAGCETVLVGGHVDVEDAAGNVLRISYAGCGERSVTYNGWPVPPRRPPRPAGA